MGVLSRSPTGRVRPTGGAVEDGALSVTVVQQWLNDYVAAWRSGNAAEIRGLFCEDAEYCYQPWGEPVRGADAIVADWLENQDEPNSWRAEYQTLLVDGDRAIACGETHYPSEDRTYSNLFILKFTGDGKCCSFTEWFMKHPKSREGVTQ